MKVVFAGPSIHGANIDFTGMRLMPPASRGDIAVAVRQGATRIGLVDGHFGWVASAWHKEILFALESGVSVLGAASMGALRAAECVAFGMVPIGRIANWYVDGTLDDDGDVAITHGPPELDFAPLTEALVDARATLDLLLSMALISSPEHFSMRRAASQLNFRDRTSELIVAVSLPPNRQRVVLDLYASNKVSIKSEDARLLVACMHHPVVDCIQGLGWKMADSFTWKGSGL